jgi:xylulokinase
MDLYILVHAKLGAAGADMSRRHATIGVDVGTSGCKAVLLSTDGEVIHTAEDGYPTRRTVAGEVTQDPMDWLAAVARTLRACAQAGGDVEVTGLGITAPAHAAVLADDAGDPLAPSLLAFDARPATIAAELRAHYGEALFEATFVDLSAGWTLAQLAWLRSERPELWPRIRWLLTEKDWIRFRLTGEACIDGSDAAGTAMIDQRNATWLEAVCADVGLRPEQLPPIVPSTAVAGGLSPGWARETGLPAGTPVVAGATDTAAELVSVGAHAAGSSLVKIASTGTVVGVSSEPVVDRRLLTYPHAIPGAWYTLAATNTATVAYQWLRETVFAAPAAAPAVTYEDMNQRASGVPAGAEGVLFLPYLEGERTPHFDTRLRATFLGLTASHRREHLARAVLEGVALALRDCRDVMAAAGLPADAPYLAGGGMASDLWRRILVSVLGVEGRLPQPQGPAIGAAILAAVPGATNAATIAAQVSLPHCERVAPEADWVSTYDALHDIYGRASVAVTEISHELVELRTGPPGREPAT